MKLIDRNGRLFGKISVIDLVVVAVVIVLAAALYFKNNQTHTGNAVVEQKITFQIRARGVYDYVADAIQVGDGVYDKDYASGGKSIGVITDIQIERDPGGLVDADETVDLLITLEGWGLVDGKRYTLNRVYALGVNSSRTYYTKQAQFIGTVADILPSGGSL